jgi:glyoxylase-like metal-dependent hydrolase (beta-lactamase superfamily II)
VIATRKETVLVDAGNSPRLARLLKAELIRVGLPPVSRIIYTHHHWDHTYGACEFDLPVIAHVRCRTYLQAESHKPWSQEYLQEEIRRDPRLTASYQARAHAIEDWNSFRIVLPEELFDQALSIDLDELVLELEHVGGEHADDSIIIRLPQDGVMFLGDCYYPPPLHLRGPDSAPSLEMLRELQNPAYELYVEGHDSPFTYPELIDLLEGSH